MKTPKEYKDLPLVPESVLKKRHDLDDLKRKRQAHEDEQRLIKQHKQGKKKELKQRGGGTIRDAKKGSYVLKPATMLAKAKARRNEKSRYNRVLRKGMMKRASDEPIFKTRKVSMDDDDNDDERGETYQKENSNDVDENKVVMQRYQANSVGAPYVFVIRIREDAGSVPNVIFNTMRSFRLHHPNTGVFLKYDAVTRKKLHLIEPWVIYGKPSEGVVKDLLERNAFGRVQGEKVPLSDNTMIEKELGSKHGLICMEDLVHELTTVGESFEAVRRFLYPFPLVSSRSEFEKKKLALKQGKDYGDKGEEIDEYIRNMV